MSNTSTVEAVPHQRHGLAESLEIASLKVPFRIKVAAVWLVIGGLLLGGFFKSGFDIAWMVDHAFAIFKAVWVTIAFSIIAIACAVALALLGALGRVSRNPIAYGVSGFYTSFFRGTPLIVQLFLWYLALPQLALGSFRSNTRPGSSGRRRSLASSESLLITGLT